MPRVSICIPTYNTARYLPQAIESILAQDFTDYELVVCDNASTDETPAIVRRYNDSRIRYLRSEELTNQAGNFNRCLDAARGELVTLLHSDDYFLPGFLANRVGILEGDSELGMVFGAVKIINAEGEVIGSSERWPEDRRFETGRLTSELVMGCLVSPPSLMVRRSCVERAGKFRTDLTWGHDWEWTIRMSEYGGAFYTSRPLAVYRVHDKSGTAEILSAAKNGDQERRILQETFTRLGTNDLVRRQRPAAYRALSRRQMYFAEQSLLAGRKSGARSNLWYAARADRTMLFRPTFWALLIATWGTPSIYHLFRTLRGTSMAPSGEG
jgi:glycosyltransferase involved in cell wall biosynthesis